MALKAKYLVLTYCDFPVLKLTLTDTHLKMDIFGENSKINSIATTTFTENCVKIKSRMSIYSQRKMETDLKGAGEGEKKLLS